MADSTTRGEKRLSGPKQKTKRRGIFRAFGDALVHNHKRLTDGSWNTKLSYLIMGFGNLCKGQIIKGLIFLLIQVSYITFMVSCPVVNSTPLGYKAFKNFITLGTVEGDIFTPADNSMLMMLFGVITISITIAYLFVFFMNVESSYKGDLQKRKKGRANKFREDVAELLDGRFHVCMLTPAVIGAVTFTLLPTIFMILIAFTNYDKEHIAGLVLFDWVGFKNFSDIFTNPAGEISARFIPVITWTFIWAILATFLNYFGGLVLALMISKKGIKIKPLFRTIFILTIAIPQFISLLSMRNLIGEYGPFQKMLMDLNILKAPMSMLENADSVWLARIWIIVINLWVGIPYSMLMTSGILTNAPRDMYEAAYIDGASKFTTFRKITLPYVFFITTPYLITSFIGNITSFNIIYLLTKGFPKVTGGYIAGGTDLLVTWLYKLTIDEQQYNLGAVIGIITFIINASITLLFYRRSRSYREEDTFQ